MTVLPNALTTQQTTRSTEALKLEVHSRSECDYVLEQWRRLEHRVGDRGLLASADWVEVWLEGYGDLVPYRFLTAHADGQLRGICLVTEGVRQLDGPVGIKTLHVGTAGEPDADSVCAEYQRLMVEPAYESAFVSAIVDYMNCQRGFDQWNVDGFSGLDAAVFKQHDPELHLREMPNPYFDFNLVRQKGGDLLSALQKEPRRQVRRSLEVLHGVSTEWADSLDSATDVFHELIELHQARWTADGLPGVYSSERFTRYHERLLVRLVPQGKMVFVRVKSLKGTVGCVQILIDRNRACVYQCGRGNFEGEKCSPGVICDYFAMEACLSHGLDAYDLMSPESQHKRNLSNASTSMVWGVHRHRRLKFFALNQARKVKHWIKQNQEPTP